MQDKVRAVCQLVIKTDVEAKLTHEKRGSTAHSCARVTVLCYFACGEFTLPLRALSSQKMPYSFEVRSYNAMVINDPIIQITDVEVYNELEKDFSIATPFMKQNQPRTQ